MKNKSGIMRNFDDDIRNDTAKHYKEVRKLLHGNLPMREDPVKESNFPYIAVAVIIILIAVCLLHSCAFGAELNEDKAVKAIIGEAENQGYDGMVAIGCALRNRGSFRGVYGLHSYRVKHHLYSHKTLEEAQAAWIESYRMDVTNGATGWGNADDVNKFCSTTWWSHCIITAHIGDHWFYRRK